LNSTRIDVFPGDRGATKSETDRVALGLGVQMASNSSLLTYSKFSMTVWAAVARDKLPARIPQQKCIFMKVQSSRFRFERNESGSLSVGSQELLICKYVWIRCIAMVYFEGDSTILSSGDRQPRCFHRKRFGRYDGSRSPLPCQDQCPG